MQRASREAFAPEERASVATGGASRGSARRAEPVVTGANETQSPEGATEACDDLRQGLIARIEHLLNARLHRPFGGDAVMMSVCDHGFRSLRFASPVATLRDPFGVRNATGCRRLPADRHPGPRPPNP